MRIKVIYFAAIRDLFGCSEEDLDLAPGLTIAGLAEILATRVPGLRGHLPSLAWALNFEFITTQAELGEGDEVALLPPVSGGRQ